LIKYEPRSIPANFIEQLAKNASGFITKTYPEHIFVLRRITSALQITRRFTRSVTGRVFIIFVRNQSKNIVYQR